MAMPAAVRDVTVLHISLFCENRIPLDARDEVRLEYAVEGDSITIIERRPPWSKLFGPDWTRMTIAQLRYDERTGTWSLYAADSDDRWFPYDVDPAPDVGPLLAEIGEDPTGIFWG
jgi:Protein of unknown function (DUF3024)